MSRVIYICHRSSLPRTVERVLDDICCQLAPDNIVPTPASVAMVGLISYAIINPTTFVRREGGSLLVGHLFEDTDCWDAPLAPFPDGSYALFRASSTHCEIVSDPAASRTVWYYFDDHMLIAATSQRAIVKFLGTFHFDERTVPWMLSTGTMGPVHSWDRRIKRMGADCSVVLDRRGWSLSARGLSTQVVPVRRSREEHIALLEESIFSALRSFDFASGRWALPLSGGYDSRGILLSVLRSRDSVRGLTAITWGLQSALDHAGNDANIAKALADVTGIPHRFYGTDRTDVSLEEIVARFVALGEGRIDHIAGYMDGFRVWKELFEEGVEGIIRGDQAFGAVRSWSHFGVRYHGGWRLWSDHPNLKGERGSSLPQHTLVEEYSRAPNESLQMWADRLRVEQRLPTNLAALADLKSSYVDQANPLLSRRILRRVRELPDRWRANKRLWKQMVSSMSPPVPFATHSANAERLDILREGEMLELLHRTLRSSECQELFDEAFVDLVRSGLAPRRPLGSGRGRGSATALGTALKSGIPKPVRKVLRENLTGTNMDFHALAFRVMLICRTVQLLDADARDP